MPVSPRWPAGAVPGCPVRAVPVPAAPRCCRGGVPGPAPPRPHARARRCHWPPQSHAGRWRGSRSSLHPSVPPSRRAEPSLPPSAGLSAGSGRDRTMSTLKVYSTSVTGSREVSGGGQGWVHRGPSSRGWASLFRAAAKPPPPYPRCPLPCSRCTVPIFARTHPSVLGVPPRRRGPYRGHCAEPGWHAGCVPTLRAPLHLPITCLSNPGSRSNLNRAK